MIESTKLMGVDVGFSKTRAATGIACLDRNELHLTKAKTPWEKRKENIPAGFRPHVIAIDGPLLPDGADRVIRRRCEYIFIRAPFSKRCKPGLSHYGFGLNLRDAAAEACAQFSQLIDGSAKSRASLLIRRDSPIVEAFPNAFLGVLLHEDAFLSALKFIPGKKFDWLYDCVVKDQNTFTALSESLDLPQQVWNKLKDETDHELRAALICLLTAAFAARGTATVVGNPIGGWFWLPPKSLWQGWAVVGLNQAEEKCNLI